MHINKKYVYKILQLLFPSYYNHYQITSYTKKLGCKASTVKIQLWVKSDPVSAIRGLNN